MDGTKLLTGNVIRLDRDDPAGSQPGGWLTASTKTKRRALRDRVGVLINPYMPAQVTPGDVGNYTDQDRFLTNAELWQVYRRTPDVRAAIDSIVRRVATFDWSVLPTMEPRAPEYDRALTLSQEVNAWLSSPNGNGDTWQDIWTATLTDLLVYDVGAIELVRDATGKLAELVVLKGSSIRPIMDEHGRLLAYEQDRYGDAAMSSFLREQEEAPTFPVDDMIFLRLFPTTVTPLGNPLIEALVNEVITLLRGSEHTMLALDADEIPPGILVLAGVAGQAAREARADLMQMRGQDHKIRVLTTPDPTAIGARWVELRHTPKDLEFSEILKEVRRTVWRTFGVMPVEMGASDSMPRATAQVQLDVASSHLVTPMLELLQARINRSIVPAVARAVGASEEELSWLAFQWDREARLTPADAKANSERLRVQIDAGVTTRNEARAELGLLPIDGGDVVTIQTPYGPMPLITALAGGVGPTPGGGGPPAEPPPGDTPDDDGTEPTGDVELEPEIIETIRRAVGDTDPTNFPTPGDDSTVSLRNSEHAVFDPGFVERVRVQYPEIWSRGGNVIGSTQYRRLKPVVARGGAVESSTEEKAVRLREAWAARRTNDYRLPGVVSQMKWLVVGGKGADYMKVLVKEEMLRVDAARTRRESIDGRSGTHHHRHGWRTDDAPFWDAETRAVALPSEWLDPKRFKDVRTIDLERLAATVAGYAGDVFPLFDEARHVVGSFIASTYNPDGFNDDEADAARRAVVKAVDDLAAKWSLTTRARYFDAAKLGHEHATEWTGYPVAEDWEQRAELYYLKAMSWLVAPDGMLTNVRDRLLAIVSAVTRSAEPPPDVREWEGIDNPTNVTITGEGVAGGSAQVYAPEGVVVGAEVAVVADAALGAFAANQHRVMNWAGRMSELANQTLADGVVEGGATNGVPAEWFVEWVATHDKRTCSICDDMGSRGFQAVASLPYTPGGDTECRARCRCVLVYWTKDEVSSNSATRMGPL